MCRPQPTAAWAVASSNAQQAPKAKPSLRERRRPRISFNSTHGWSGTLSTLLTCVAIAVQRLAPSNPTFALLAAVSSVVTAASGVDIVDQAPKQTVVMKHPIRVVPPHRDAFRRTAHSIFYLSGRICWNAANAHILGNSSTGGIINWAWGLAALFYAATFFIPNIRDIDWTNGNTYVFVVPMAIGLSADAMFQLPTLQCSRDEVCWNDHIITNMDLLWVLLSGLVVAFVFTLAFRGVLGIRGCYWGAAAVVHGIVAYLIVKALPFALMQIVSR